MSRWPHLGEGVAKQKCGSCRFFQEAGLAGSGWCHHPLRKVSSGVMIMVRRNELACRDEWSRSLWTARETGEGDAGELFQRPPNLGPVSPLGARNVQSLLGAQEHSSTSPIDGEDVLLSEARIVSDSRQVQPPANHAYPTGYFDPRTAVFRAREAYRDRNRAKESVARQSAGAEPISPAGAEPISPAGAEQGERSEATDGRRIDDPFAPGPRRDQPEDQQTEFGPANSGEDEDAPADEEASRVWPVLIPGTRDQTPFDRSPMDLATTGPPAEAWTLERFLSEPELPADAGGTIEPDYPGLSFDRIYEFADQKLPDWFTTDLPHSCRTCRDYRPVGNGQRGWCMNAWAFSQQTIVHEDQIAPCQSSIGSWWAPVDNVWMVAADVSSHGRATPLLDRFVAQDVAEKRRS